MFTILLITIFTLVKGSPILQFFPDLWHEYMEFRGLEAIPDVEFLYVQNFSDCCNHILKM